MFSFNPSFYELSQFSCTSFPYQQSMDNQKNSGQFEDIVFVLQVISDVCKIINKQITIMEKICRLSVNVKSRLHTRYVYDWGCHKIDNKTVHIQMECH